MYTEIYEKIRDTLSLTSNAYKKIKLSYNNSNPQYYPDKLLFKILNNKTDSYMNSIIRDFIGDQKIEIFNKKTTTFYIALEEVQRISKENYNILDKIQQKDKYFISDSDTLLIKKINKVKTFNELYNYRNSKKPLFSQGSYEGELKRENNIYNNIYNFHKNSYHKDYFI